MTYNIEGTVEPASNLQREVTIPTSFKIARVAVQDGQGLVVLKVTSTEKTLWQRPIELSKIVGPLNLFRPRVSAGLLTFELNNPTMNRVHFKITIS